MSELSPEASALLRDAGRAVEPDARSLREAQVALHEKLRLGTPSILCARDQGGTSPVDADDLASAVQQELPAATAAPGWASTVALKGGLVALVAFTAAALFFGRHQAPSTAPAQSVAGPQITAAVVAVSRGSDEQPPVLALQSAVREHEAKATPTARSAVRTAPRKLHTSEPPTVERKPQAAREASDHGGANVLTQPHARDLPSVQRVEKSSEPATKLGVSLNTPEPPSPFATDSLERELAYLQKARAALQHGDSKLSLALLREHQARYPRGALLEERLATEVLALCLARRRDEARASLQRLTRIAPQSPYLAQLTRSCAAD